MVPLFAAQKAMYFFEKLNPNTTTYHHTAAMAIHGKLDEDKFIHAVNLLIKRHEVLRSSVVENDNDIFLNATPYAAIQNPANQVIKTIKVRYPFQARKGSKPKVEDSLETLQILKKEAVINEPFDLQKGPLWRAALLKFSDTEYHLVFVFHHLIVDIGSQNIILQDLSELYNSLIEQRAPKLPALAQLSQIKSVDETTNKLLFWKEQLEDLTTLSLQADYPPQHNFRFVGDRIYFDIDALTMHSFENLASKVKCTTNNVILASLYAMLYRYTSESDICIGIASANRRGFNREVTNLVNCFVNSVPIRLLVNQDATFAEFLSDVSHCLKEALENQIALDEIIVNALSNEIKSSSNVASPFNILCNFNKEKIPLNFKFTDITHPIELNLRHTKFENFGINFDMLPDGSCRGFLEFNSDRFRKKSMEGFVKHLQIFWKKIIENPDLKISHVPILTTEEISLLNNAQNNQKDTPYDNFFHLMFAQLVEKKSHQNAIVFHGEGNQKQTISFAELDKVTDILAAYLINLGVGPEKTIGVAITRSINLIIAFVAILKAGGVIVPLETSVENTASSNSLLHHKLIDSFIDVVLVDNQTAGLFSSYKDINRAFFALNIEDASYKTVVKQLGLSYRRPRLTPENLAYIMYTSGTTGIPKGVMIEHASLVNLIYSLRDRKLKLGSKVLGTAPHTFDCFIFELMEAWFGAEGELHFINEKERLLPSILEKIIQKYQINCATFLPDIIKNLDPKNLPSLRDVICMGATPSEEILELWLLLGKIIRNEYGPTEATICTTENPYKHGKSHTNIGKPIRNMNIFILDKNFRGCPIGVPGELYISGGLARGYVGNAILTADRFPSMIFNEAEHSFSEVTSMEIDEPENRVIKKNDNRGLKRSNTGGHDINLTHKVMHKRRKTNNVVRTSERTIRLYKTGDLGCYAEDGSIIFLGRTDRQVKIHGIRIELEGIEALLQKHPDIKTVYLTLNDSKDALNAYIVTKSANVISKSDIDEYLKTTSVPLIAWPKLVIHLKEMPITKNGKLDIKALPKPLQATPTFMLPSTDLQKELCKIWAEVLRTQAIDISKTFRQHGGDSLSLATLETKLNKTFPTFSRASFNILNRDITIVQLESVLKTYLANPPLQTKTSSLININGTLFSGGKINPLAFQPLQSSVFSAMETPISLRNKF